MRKSERNKLRGNARRTGGVRTLVDKPSTPAPPTIAPSQWFLGSGCRSINNARTHTRVILYCTLTLFPLFVTMGSLFVTLFTLPPALQWGPQRALT